MSDDNDLIRRGDAKREIAAAMWARDHDEFQRRMNAIPAVPAPDVVEIDLRVVMMEEIEKAAEQSPWVPPEYTMNEVVSDCCAFLREPRESAPVTPALRAQIADAQAELHGPIKHLSAQDYSNVIAHLSPELEPNGELPNRNSLMMALVEATNAAREANARAERAEEALAARIRSALTIAPAHDAAKVAEVFLAFENVDSQLDDEGEFTERAWEQLRAALAAMKEVSGEA